MYFHFTTSVVHVHNILRPLKRWKLIPSYSQDEVIHLGKYFSSINTSSNSHRELKETELPPLGVRVRRGPDWKWGDQDKHGPGTVVGHDGTNSSWCQKYFLHICLLLCEKYFHPFESSVRKSSSFHFVSPPVHLTPICRHMHCKKTFNIGLPWCIWSYGTLIVVLQLPSSVVFFFKNRW